MRTRRSYRPRFHRSPTRRRVTPRLEVLEDRAVPSISSLDTGALAVNGFQPLYTKVAMSGNYAVATGNESPSSNLSAAFIFQRSDQGTPQQVSDDVWLFQAMVKADDEAFGDFFGYSLAISGDTILVGAPRQNNTGGTEAGAVYVFVRNGNQW